MKKFGQALAAIFFPWIIFLILGQLGYALLAFLIQATGFGWIIATIWAWRSAPALNQQKQKKTSEPTNKTGQDLT
jgi:hypothetical protein